MMRAPVPTTVPGSPRRPIDTSVDADGGPRWIELWKRLGGLRAQLRERQRAVRQIESMFRREIAPREHRLTDALTLLSEILVNCHRGAGLDRAATLLLGVWVVENLEHLHDHPFVDEERLQRLVARWHRGRASGDRARHIDERRESADRDRPSPRSADDSAARPDGHDAIGLEAMLLGSQGGTDRFHALVERLFRRVAQALHPDREPDEDQRTIKQRLMAQALEARDARNLDTLLSLHVQHVGDALPGIEPAALEGALERQLEGMRRALARSGAGADPMQRGIIERYGGPDDSVRHRRIAHHAALLDRECERIKATVQELQRPGGLATALAERRMRELDHQAIDELTGMGDAW